MTQQEHLSRIRTRCVELLETAESRTPGWWRHDTSQGQVGSVESKRNVIAMTQELIELAGDPPGQIVQRDKNAAFIASAAGSFEAALASTVAAIDTLKPISESEMCADAAHACDHPIEASEAINSIIASWPIELLQQK